MTDDTAPTVTSINISDPHRVQTVFVNQLAGAGHLNGVVNITFVTAQFTPTHDNKIDPDLVISARLRMDVFCAESLYAQLGLIIQQMTKANGTTAQ